MATLAGNTIASTYPLLLKIDSSGVDGTLRKVEDGDATDSSLYISTTSIGIDSTDKFYLDADQGTPHTYFHQVSADKLDVVVGGQTILELQEGGGGASDSMSIQALNKFYLDGGGSTYIQESADGVMTFVCDARTMLTLTQGSAGTGEVCVNEGSNADVDFRVESNGEDEAILVDATNNTLYINKGNTAFTTKIGSLNSTGFEGLQVSSAGVIINDGGHANCDFKVESENEDEAIFLNSDTNTLYINKGNSSFATHIHSTNAVAISVGANGPIFNDDGNSENDFRIESDNNTHMFYVNSGTDRISMGTAGASPSSTLHVEAADTTATVHIAHFECTESAVETADVLVRMDFSADADVDGARAISFHDSGGEIGSVTLDGNATAFNTSSDYRLKTDLKVIPDATGTINQLKLYDFAWKKNTDKRLTGVLAHEAKEIVPYAVIGEKDATITEEYFDENGDAHTKEVVSAQGVDYSKFVPLLLKAVQELSAKVAALEAA
jgi:hypothetical protein